MHNSHHFLQALAVVLCAAAITTIIFQRLRQPVVVGYILAGLIIGPHVPAHLVADPEIVRTLSEVGVILLMFSLGLEFSLRKLARVGPTASLTALVETTLMMWLGFTVVQLLGWNLMDGLFAGAVMAISSTTIVARTFAEQQVDGRLRDKVVGILLVEDLIAILLLASLTAIASGSGLSSGPLFATVGKLALFLAAMIGCGMLLVPRLMFVVRRLKRAETTIVASVGLCFAFALLAVASGYSAALGAFLAGSLIAEAGAEKRVEQLVEPVRDIFAAVFFVSVGMLIDPVVVVAHWPIILLFTVLVIGGKIVGVTCGSFLTGSPLRTSLQTGMSLAQVGEFSFIIAGLGLALNATNTILYPAVIVVSGLTTLATPWLIRASDPVASWVDRRLPTSLQTFTVLYGSWVEGLRNATRTKGAKTDIRRRVVLLLLDTALAVGAIVIPAATSPYLLAGAHQRFGIDESVGYPLLITLAVALATYFVLGMIRVGRRLGQTLAELVLPAGTAGRLDLADAPRRLLVVTFELVIVVAVGAPLLALTRPFLPAGQLLALLGVLLGVLGLNFWRNAANLQGHVRAGAEVLVDTLAWRSREETAPSRDESLQQIETLLPGLGVLCAVQLEAGAQAVGKTLAELNLRALTGASVLAITRAAGNVTAPTAREILQVDDVLALTGTREAIADARALLNRR